MLYMNIFYQTIYPASLLPWCILALFYMVHNYVFLFAIAATHIATHACIISHIPLLKMDIHVWNRILHLQRLALLITYAFRNQWNQHFIAFSMYIFIVTIAFNKKLMDGVLQDGQKWMSFPVHLVCTLCFCSTAGWKQIIIAAACLGIYYLIKKPVKPSWEIYKTIQEYFFVRMAYTYALCILEWSLSDMNNMSLPFITIACVVFNGLIVYHTPKVESNGMDVVPSPVGLPPDYPFPLNIKNAMQRCNTAKKLFKSHEL